MVKKSTQRGRPRVHPLLFKETIAIRIPTWVLDEIGREELGPKIEAAIIKARKLTPPEI